MLHDFGGTPRRSAHTVHVRKKIIVVAKRWNVEDFFFLLEKVTEIFLSTDTLFNRRDLFPLSLKLEKA